MISKKMEKALNVQIMEEEHASRIYLAMASWCEANAYPGAAAFLYRHTNEEREHAEKILKYVNYRGGHATLAPLPEIANTFKNLLDVFEQAMEHEKYVTACIKKIYEVAMSEKDYGAQIFLQWYIKEQEEEEDTFQSILDNYKNMKDCLALFDKSLMDKE
ncbi:MAG: ferritin [Bacteroidales bacterium]|jgi:ferritin|nr:ferritin [Bacteroidales bacterium]